jgi:nucleotide-binding universal stress UspA family protein
LAELALPYAEKLAGGLGSEIILVCVRDISADPQQGDCQSYHQKIVELIKEAAAAYSNTTGDGTTIHAKAVLLRGQPAEKIVGYADSEGIGLIVMATHGQSGMQRWALGSVADKVVRATTRPVLLIRARGARPDMRAKGVLNKILVPLDGSKESEAIIPFVEELACRLRLKVVLIQILAKGYDTMTQYIPLSEQQVESDRARATAYLNEVGAGLKGKGIAVEERLTIGIRFGNAAEQIIEAADEVQADLLAMTTHGRSGVGRWAFGSVAERVLHDGKVPLLLVRSPGARGEQ